MALPDKLGRYRVEKLVGKGAMGTVYRGYDPRIDRTVALKTFTIQALDPDDQLNLIQRFHLRPGWNQHDQSKCPFGHQRFQYKQSLQYGWNLDP